MLCHRMALAPDRRMSGNFAAPACACVRVDPSSSRHRRERCRCLAAYFNAADF